MGCLLSTASEKVPAPTPPRDKALPPPPQQQQPQQLAATTATDDYADEQLEFDPVHEAVIREIEAHPEIWVSETKELAKVVERFEALKGRVPMMRLVHGQTIERLGRLPRSDERQADGTPYWRTLGEVHRAWKPRPIEGDPAGKEYTKLSTNFLSHRWTRAKEGLPDDTANTKATIVAALSRYDSTVYQGDVWWWIVRALPACAMIALSTRGTSGGGLGAHCLPAAQTRNFARLPCGNQGTRWWIARAGETGKGGGGERL
jgi:hypothetical protein